MIKNWLFYNLRYIRRPPWDSGITPPELQAFLKGLSPGRAIDLVVVRGPTSSPLPALAGR